MGASSFRSRAEPRCRGRDGTRGDAGVDALPAGRSPAGDRCAPMTAAVRIAPMKKFLVLYKAPTSAFEQMQKSTPEQQKAGMDAWMAWSKKAASSIVDM